MLVELDGTKRQIVSGIAEHYVVDDLIGKMVVIVANLKPVVIRGEESNGMLLAISNSDNNFKDITNDLFQRMDNLNTKLEVEQVKLSENLIGSTNSVKEMIKFSEQSQNRTAKEMLNATQKVTNILQDNSKRGAWGEKAADDLLKSMGLIEGKSYQKQQTLPWKSEDESLLKPDFVFNIDGQDKLFIMDVKFPFCLLYTSDAADE